MTKKVLLLSSFIIYVFFINPIFFDWSMPVKACALLLIMQFLWLGRVFSLAYSSLIMMILLSFHFFSYEETLSFVASPIVWLLFATYILSGAFIRSGLAHRLSLHILYWSKGRGGKLVGALFFLMTIFTVMIPSNIGRASLLTSVLDKMVGSIRTVEKVEKLPKALFIGVCYVTALTGALIATGASSTIYTYGFINDHLDQPITFLKWMILMVPPIIVFMIIFGIVLYFLFPFEKVRSNVVISFIKEELEKVGPIKTDEIKVMSIIGITVILWILEPWHHFSVPLIGLLGAAATVFPGIGVWKWDDAKDKVNWDMILFFASTLMLSTVLIKSGLLDIISKTLVRFVSVDHVILLLIFLLILVTIVRIFFVNVLGIMTFIIPLSFSIGEHLPGVSPALFPLVFFLAGIPGFFFITQSPVHMISFSHGYFTEKELVKTGILTAVLWLAIIMATALFYWNFLL